MYGDVSNYQNDDNKMTEVMAYSLKESGILFF